MIDYKVFKIQGMHCADCALKIEQGVLSIKGITSARVLSSKLLVNITDSFDQAAIMALVEQLGYQALPDGNAKAVSLHIEGMDCIDEIRILEKQLSTLSGLIAFEIKLTNQMADVTYDAAKISSPDIIKVIAKTGMKARPIKSQAKPWWRDARTKLIAVSGFLLAIAFILERSGLDHNVTKFIYGTSIIVGGYYPVRMSIAGLRARTLNIYTLLVAAAIGAVILGFWDEAALLVFVYTWGAILETYATEKARGSLKLLMGLAPREALAKRAGRELTVPVEDVQIGEVIIVKPGAKIPLDGVIAAGSSTVDQAPITGESIAVCKNPGDTVFAASINQRGSLEIKVSKPSKDTTLARIINSVEKAETKKSSYQHFAERFGRIYTPTMFVVATIVATVPWMFGAPFAPWFYRGLVALVVSCSCGLVLSVPISVLASISAAARRGVLIKGGTDLEAAGKVKAVVFDKTGTLTTGTPIVTDIISYNVPASHVLYVAASVESRSEHPLAGAILQKAHDDGLAIKPFDNVEVLVGLGVKGYDKEKIYYVCNRRLCDQMSVNLGHVEKNLARLENDGKTAVLVLAQNEVLGIIAVADKLRPEAKGAITNLKKAGVKRTIMLTGDNEVTAKALAAQANIDECRAQLLPEEKVDAIMELKQMYGQLAMIGDGINDAPAIAAADVGIAMGAAGTDIAIETADMALMSDDLSQITYALKISRKAMAAIKQNVVVSLAIIALVVTLALIGKIGLVPGLLINELSALLVMANGLRLLRG